MTQRDYEIQKLRLLILLEKNHQYYSKEVTRLLDEVIDDDGIHEFASDKFRDLKEFYKKNIVPLKSQYELLEKNYRKGLI